MTRELIRHWIKCLKAGKSFKGTSELPFGVVVDGRKRTVAIPLVNLKLDDLSAADFERLVSELQGGARRLIPHLMERRLVEAATQTSADDVEAELRRIEEQRRQKDAARRAAEAGRPAIGHGRVDEPVPRDLAAEIAANRTASSTGTAGATHQPE